MDSLYLLLPLSALLVLALIGVFAWALDAGQFDDLEREGARLLEDERDDLSPRGSDPAADALTCVKVATGLSSNNPHP